MAFWSPLVDWVQNKIYGEEEVIYVNAKNWFRDSIILSEEHFSIIDLIFAYQLKHPSISIEGAIEGTGQRGNLTINMKRILYGMYEYDEKYYSSYGERKFNRVYELEKKRDDKMVMTGITTKYNEDGSLCYILDEGDFNFVETVFGIMKSKDISAEKALSLMVLDRELPMYIRDILFDGHVYTMDKSSGFTLDLPDSGNRRKFDSGAVRDMEEGKGRFDLLPAYAIFRVARHYEAGAKKYDDRNWEKGIPVSAMMDSALRHIFKYLDGMDDEDHLAAATWNLLGAIQMEEKMPDMQDIPSRKREDIVTLMADNQEYTTIRKDVTDDETKQDSRDID